MGNTEDLTAGKQRERDTLDFERDARCANEIPHMGDIEHCKQISNVNEHPHQRSTREALKHCRNDRRTQSSAIETMSKATARQMTKSLLIPGTKSLGTNERVSRHSFLACQLVKLATPRSPQNSKSSDCFFHAHNADATEMSAPLLMWELCGYLEPPQGHENLKSGSLACQALMKTFTIHLFTQKCQTDARDSKSAADSFL